MIAVACSCGVRFDLPEKYAGRSFKCRKCGAKNTVPNLESNDPSVVVAEDDVPIVTPQPLSNPPEADATRMTSEDSSSPSHVKNGNDGAPDEAMLTSFLSPAEGAAEMGRLGGYRILKILGAGGMGVVYKAEDPQLKRIVALKVMLPSLGASATARQRFLREARAIAALQHDHIVTIYQVGEDRDVPFIAMQFLQGESLADRLKRVGRLDIAEVVRIGREIAQGLAEAHDHGLIHRDIKPANIWLEVKGAAPDAAPQNSGGRVKILDFGLAREAEGSSHITKDGAITGTPAYMAPEQLNGRQPDYRSDLYSLGCVYYELATGTKPFKGPTTMTLIKSILLDEPQSPEKINEDVPPMLANLIMRLLSKASEDRPKSARTIVTALKAIEDAATVTAKVDQPPPLPKAGERSAKSVHAKTVKISKQAPRREEEPAEPARENAPAARPAAKRSARWLILAVAGFSLLFLGALAAGGAFLVYSRANEPGTLFVQAALPDMQVIIKQGETVVVDRTSKREIRLAPGTYQIELADPRPEWELTPKEVVMPVRGQEVIRIDIRAGPVPPVVGVDGPFLGVRGESVAEGAKVLRVVPGSAAYKAGLLINDAIYDIGGQPVNGAPAMITAVKQKKPGDVVKVKVKRADQPLEFDAVLQKGPASMTPPCRVEPMLDENQYQAFVNKAGQDGFRMSHVHAYSWEGTTRFAAVAVKDVAYVGWKARHGVTRAQFDAENDEQKRKSLRLTSLCEYIDKGQKKIAAIWMHDPRKINTSHQLNLDAAQLEKVLRERKEKGFHPISVVAASDGETQRFCAIFTDESIVRSTVLDVGVGEIGQTINAFTAKGQRPIDISGYETPNGTRFVMTFTTDKEFPRWLLSREMNAAQFQQRHQEKTAEGFHLHMASAYFHVGELRYAGIWVKE